MKEKLKLKFEGRKKLVVLVFPFLFLLLMASLLIFGGGEEEIVPVQPPPPALPPSASSVPPSSPPPSPPVSAPTPSPSADQVAPPPMLQPSQSPQASEPPLEEAVREEEIKENPFISEYLRKLVEQAVKEVIEEEKSRIRQEMARMGLTGKGKEKKEKKQEGKEKKKEEEVPFSSRIPDVLKVRSIYTAGGYRYVETSEYGLIGKGSRIEGWEVAEVLDDRIVLERKGKTKVMRFLFEFSSSSKGGEQNAGSGSEGQPPIPPFPVQ